MGGAFQRRPAPVFLDPDAWEARQAQKQADFVRTYSGTPPTVIRSKAQVAPPAKKFRDLLVGVLIGVGASHATWAILSAVFG